MANLRTGTDVEARYGDFMYAIDKIRKEFLRAAILTAMLLVFSALSHASVTARPAAVNFGSQAVGAASAPRIITVTNTGYRDTTIHSASIVGENFSYSGLSLPITLSPGRSVTFYVTYKPDMAEVNRATMVLTRNNGSTTIISLSGTGGRMVPPAITMQPSSQTITARQAAVFSVAATGTAPLAYQWKKNGVRIPGGTSSSYKTSPATAADNATKFTVVVTNSAGSATSTSAVLTVGAGAVKPSITSHPANQTVKAGQSATFNVAATGTAPMTYQWSKNGIPISGATASTYTTPGEVASDNGAKFSVTLRNSAGSSVSASATLTVNAPALALAASSTALSFGNVTVPTSGSKTVTLTNVGNANVTISNVSVSGPGFTATGVTSGLILPPGKAATMAATFTPAATGSVTGSVTVSSNASNSPHTIALSGAGTTQAKHSVVLSWTANTSKVAGYYAYGSSKSGGPYARLSATPILTTSYTDATVLSGQSYYYVVTAVDLSSVESAYSQEITASIP